MAASGDALVDALERDYLAFMLLPPMPDAYPSILEEQIDTAIRRRLRGKWLDSRRKLLRALGGV